MDGFRLRINVRFTVGVHVKFVCLALARLAADWGAPSACELIFIVEQDTI